MRILWANFYCLLDTSSGASMSAKQILSALKDRGHDVRIIGATIFDSPKGVSSFKDHWQKIQLMEKNRFIDVNDGNLTHSLLLTESTSRNDVKSSEISTWVARYRQELNYFKPEFIFFYGGGPGDFIPAEARALGIPCGAYLVNGTFSSHRWCRDVTTFITDTKATRDYYRNKLNIDPFPVGKFISEDKIAKNHSRERLLYINPSMAKGAALVVMMAQLLLDLGSEIEIEVVESRGDWATVLKAVNLTLGWPEDYCPKNIIVTPNTSDMTSIYARARVLFVPSLWWESGARVIAEAQLNGIPVAASHHGGNPEMVGAGGFTFHLPPVCYQKPYLSIPTIEGLRPIAEKIVELFENEEVYQSRSLAALENAKITSSISRNVKLLENHIAQLVDAHKPWKSNVRPPIAYKPYDMNVPYGEPSYYIPLEGHEKGIFVDCGGYDGCSAVKFILENPSFQSVSFEPNDLLWDYYEDVPTTLIKAGIAGSSGMRRFTVDTIDGDGSSLLAEKRIDYTGQKKNAEFPTKSIRTIDIEEVMAEIKDFDKIVLKLDIEGAEYEVLQRLIKTGSIKQLSKLYIEWHWEKIGMPYEDHLKFADEVRKYVDIEEWDALDLSVHLRGDDRGKVRKNLVSGQIKKNISGYQTNNFLMKGFL